jgi:flagellar biosynthesis protein FlhB
MKAALRILALMVAAGALATWLATGARRGWTQTTVDVKKLDEVTGIEQIIHEERFVAGVDFLGAALLGAGILAGASFAFRKKNQ